MLKYYYRAVEIGEVERLFKPSNRTEHEQSRAIEFLNTTGYGSRPCIPHQGKRVARGVGVLSCASPLVVSLNPRAT